MRNETLHAKAVRLAEGGIVEINGHFVRAIDVVREVNPCDLCEMDSACHAEMAELCEEVDEYTQSSHILIFAYKQK